MRFAASCADDDKAARDTAKTFRKENMTENLQNEKVGQKLRENKMGTLPVRRLVLGMSFPPMLSMIVGSLYSIVESIFVAHLPEPKMALAAVSLVFPIQMLQLAVAVGSGVGLNSLIARRLGEKRQEEAESAASHGFLIAIFNWVLFALIGFFCAGPILGLFTQNPYILENGTIFCRIVTMGSLFQFVSICVERILQATGNMMFPMIFNMSGGVLNILLSPVFILGFWFVPRMGVMGAGIVAVFCQFVAMCLALILLFRFKHPLKVKLRGFKIRKKIFRDIYAVGVPSIVMIAIGSVMTFLLNGILIAHSEEAVAVLGIFFRLNSIINMPVFGLNQGSLPIIGYNFGARNKKRLLDAYKTAVSVALVLMALGTALFWLAPHWFLHLFNATPEMMAIGLPALRIISIGFVPSAFCIVTTGMFQALAHGLFSMIIALMRQLILIVPLTWLLLHYIGITFAWASFPVAELFAVVLVLIFLRRVYKKEIRDLGSEQPNEG